MSHTIQRVPDLRSQLCAQIDQRLRLGLYAEDVLLQEHGVAREFDVSRTPAREALAILARDGVLMRVGRGYRRPRHTVADIEQVFELRARIEPFAARLAADAASEHDLNALRRAAQRAEAAEPDALAYMGALAELRSVLFGAAHNRWLSRLIERNEGQVAYIRGQTLRDDAVRRSSVEANHRLVEAVASRDGARAEHVMASILDLARGAILRLMAPAPQAPSSAPLERPTR